jgi:hypothetical protein
MVVVAVVGVTEVVVRLVEDEVVAIEDVVILPDRFELDSLGVLTVAPMLDAFPVAVVFEDKLPIIVAFPDAVASSATLPTDVVFPESIAPVVVFSNKFSVFVAFPATVLGGVAFSTALSIDVTFSTTVGLVVAVFSLSVTGFSGKMKRGLDVVFGSRPEPSGKFCPEKRDENIPKIIVPECLEMRV